MAYEGQCCDIFQTTILNDIDLHQISHFIDDRQLGMMLFAIPTMLDFCK